MATETKYYTVIAFCLKEFEARTVAEKMNKAGISCVVHEPGVVMSNRVATFWASPDTDGVSEVEEHGVMASQ